MFEINITVSCPDLVQAATILATAMGSIKIGEPTIANPTVAPAATNASGTAQPAQYSSATPEAAPTLMPPVSQTAPVSGIPATTTPGTFNAGAAPLAHAPAFTLEQVSKAGADLITAQPARMQELMGLLAQFGVQTVNALRPDQLGAFATALRGMGAQI